MGWPYTEYIKTAKNGGFYEELLSENDFEAVVATFFCYEYGTTLLRKFRKSLQIKEYHHCSSCVIIYGIAIIYLSINKNEKKVGY